EHVARSLARALDRQGYSVEAGWAFPGDAEDPEDIIDQAIRRLAKVEGGDHAQAILSSEDATTAKVFALVERVAASSAHILVQGETGTGKEVLVEALHIASPQAQQHMVRVRGSELSEAALDNRDGPWARAAGGLLFIDEITSLPSRAQVMLAQMLDDERPQDHQRVRLMATTNQDLQALSEQGRFRTDLYYRLNQVTLIIPPLRKRHADILPLARQFIAEAAESLGRKPPQLTKAAEAQMLAYRWPGNIRELRNVMERAVLTSTGDTMGNDSLPPEIAGVATKGAIDEPASSSSGDQPKSLRAEMAALERRRILEALEKYPTQTDAAKALDIPLRTFLNRLDALGIPRARKPAKSK
ncbi:MAG: sigma 54-interacting transcriptional regulator, partial [Myxococcota bacterium]